MIELKPLQIPDGPWMERVTWFHDSPDAGDPGCVCSTCGQVIPESDFRIRCWREDGREARFHLPCVPPEWGLGKPARADDIIPDYDTPEDLIL